jgi:hypothetical protein
MKSIPYEVVAIEADKLIVQIALSSWDTCIYIQKYILLVTACGWNPDRFDQEMLRRIDRAWDPASLNWN